MPKVLIAYGSRYGSTNEITQVIVGILETKGLSVDLLDLVSRPMGDWPTLTSYAGVIVGSGIKLGQWVKEVKLFLVSKKNELNNANGRVFGLFVSAGNVSTIESSINFAREEYLEATIQGLGLSSVDFYEAFGGRLDLSNSSKLNEREKKYVQSVFNKRGEIQFNSQVSDSRDWNDVLTFATAFAERLLVNGGHNYKS